MKTGHMSRVGLVWNSVWDRFTVRVMQEYSIGSYFVGRTRFSVRELRLYVEREGYLLTKGPSVRCKAYKHHSSAALLCACLQCDVNHPGNPLRARGVVQRYRLVSVQGNISCNTRWQNLQCYMTPNTLKASLMPILKSLP